MTNAQIKKVEEIKTFWNGTESKITVKSVDHDVIVTVVLANLDGKKEEWTITPRGKMSSKIKY